MYRNLFEITIARELNVELRSLIDWFHPWAAWHFREYHEDLNTDHRCLICFRFSRQIRYHKKPPTSRHVNFRETDTPLAGQSNLAQQTSSKGSCCYSLKPDNALGPRVRFSRVRLPLFAHLLCWDTPSCLENALDLGLLVALEPIFFNRGPFKKKYGNDFILQIT